MNYLGVLADITQAVLCVFQNEKEIMKMAAAKKATAAVQAEVKETKKATTKKATATKAVAEKAEVKETKKAATTKKATTTKAAAKKVEVTVEFAGKAYSTEQLAKIAKDVWVYDLGRKATEFKTVEIYVKPEECQAYYVVNGDVTGSFAL